MMNEPKMIYDGYNKICVGDIPEDDMELCYRVLKGTEPIFMGITSISVTETYILSLAFCSTFDERCYDVDVFTNNPCMDDLNKICKMITVGECNYIPVYLYNDNNKNKIRLRGYIYAINYDIKISNYSFETWNITLRMREIK